MDEEKHYSTVDLPFYKKEILPILPSKILDFHVHVWKREHYKPEYIRAIENNSDSRDKQDTRGIKTAAMKYMVSSLDYTVEQLIADSQKMFPDREYNAVLFGSPSTYVDTSLTNDYVAKNTDRRGLYPLFITGKDQITAELLKQQILENNFWGYKVYLNWIGDDYGNVKVEDMIGVNEMRLANELGLIVLLHVPRSGRLTDPEVQRGVQNLSVGYPDVRIVLAHCGRCYHPDEMKSAIGSIRHYENVYLDTSMVMDPTVLQIVFENIDSRRVLFGTDLPIAAMRGRRVYVMDHWVDVVLEGYPESRYRVVSDNFNATFMTYEIILAIRRAAEMTGLTEDQLRRVYYDNGFELLAHVRKGH